VEGRANRQYSEHYITVPLKGRERRQQPVRSRDSKDEHSILIKKANKMHCFSTLFGKELYMFRTDLLSIIGSLNAVFTAISICHTGYVADC
jgi:hypothetical protein